MTFIGWLLIMAALLAVMDQLSFFRKEVKTMAETTAEEIRILIANQKKLIALVVKLKELLPGTLANDPVLAAEVDEAVATVLPSDPTEEVPPADPVTE